MSCFGQEEFRRVQEKITAERAVQAAQVEVAPAPRRAAYVRRKAREDRMTRRLLIGSMVLCGLAACALVGSAWFAYSSACVVPL